MLTPGSLFERRYEIVELLARGGMGAVYRARRTVLGDDVAIKVLTTPQDPSLRERFLRESRSAAQLRHPHIVAILDYDLDVEGHPYLVMEYLNGPSLLQRLAVDRRLAPHEVVRLALPLCGALHLAHLAGVVHRDIKPANVVGHEYGSGELMYKLVDFGLARLRETPDQLRLTMAREFLGTILYASPEQLRGGPADARADVYSFGALLYELLTGHPPFDHPDPLVVMTRHLTVEPRPIGELVENVPPHLVRAVQRALAKDAGDRFQSMDEFGRALVDTETAASGLTGAATRAAAIPELRGYVVERPLAAGRWGSQVYFGRHRSMRTPVAIRVLTRDHVADWTAARERFLREARAMQVAHPSVLQVRDFGEEAGLLFVVTDYIEGDSLAGRVGADGPLSWPLVQRFAGQLVDAIAALHRRDAFICGLSPFTTRLLDDEDGARVLVSSGGISQVQDLLGTLSEAALRGDEIAQSELPYVSPEVLMGDEPSVQADVFAVAALVYFMATGSPPFVEASLPELMGAMLRRKPEALAACRTDFPPSFCDAIMRALSPIPEERPADARSFAMAL